MGVKLLFVIDSEHDSFTRLLERAAGIVGLEKPQITSIVKQDIGGAYGHEQKFKQKFYETIEEPIYTPTGKLSKKTRKITQPTQEYLQCQSQLEQRLRGSNPSLIVASGNEALTAITGISGVGNYRGSILGSQGTLTRADGSPFKILVVEHPSYILRGNAKDFWVLAHDLKKAKREAEFPEIRRVGSLTYPDPLHSVERATWGMELIRQHPEWKWTLDVETRAGTLACFSIAYRDSSGELNSWCVPVQTTSGAYWSPQEEMEIWRALADACKSNPNLCNQNIEYDIYYLLRYGVEPAGVWMDTMLAHSILYPEFPKGLDFLCSFYLDDIVYWKHEGHDREAGKTIDEALWSYCCKDSVYTLRVVEKIDEELKRRGMFEMYHGKTL